MSDQVNLAPSTVHSCTHKTGLRQSGVSTNSASVSDESVCIPTGVVEQMPTTQSPVEPRTFEA
jgi:hypothetical protein